MKRFADFLVGKKKPLQFPGAHDALSARLIEAAGFSGFGIGGSGVSATQLALPDVGVQSFSEYRDAVRRIVEATDLPVMVDGENGFGDAKAVTRTVRSFEAMGVAALALEDLVFPPRLGQPPAIIPLDQMEAKLRAACDARLTDQMAIVGRTDACYAANFEEALNRLIRFVEVGADVVLAPGVPDRDSYAKLRDAVSVPIIAILVPGSPWYVPTLGELEEIGIEIALYPATVLMHMAAGMKTGLEAIHSSAGLQPENFSFGDMANALQTAAWSKIDA